MYLIIKECIEIAKKWKKALSEGPRARKVRDDNLETVDRVTQVQEIFDDHLRSIGRPETISVQKIVDLNNSRKMPTLIKHCVIAVRPQLRSEGEVESFIGAHNICVWSLSNHGLVNKEGKLTGRGTLREKYHRSSEDPGASSKTQKYNQLFNKIFKV